jgi:exodeoxyribonuclease VII small subunit
MSAKKASAKTTPPQADTPFVYTEAMQRLGTIVQQLQNDSTPLEEGYQLFKQGNELLGQCRAYLQQTELEVKQIIAEADGSLSEADFA